MKSAMIRTSWALFVALTLVQPIEAAEKKLYAKAFLGQKAPALVVEKWIGPEPKRDGKFVLLDFWATWCPPCRKTIPELNAFQKKFAEKLVVIGLSSQPEGVVRAMKEPRIEYFSAIDTQARLVNQVEVTGIPHAMLIDPDGVVRWEGFPLAQGHELTDGVIRKVMDDWAKANSGRSTTRSQPSSNADLVQEKLTRLQLKDGRVLTGRVVGTFSSRLTVRTTAGKDVDLRENEILWREDVKAERK